MQTFESMWGRKGCRVSDRTPTRAIRHHLARTSVGTSEADVVAEVRAEIQHQIATNAAERDLWTEKLIRDTLRYAAWQHAENRAEYDFVMGASL